MKTKSKVIAILCLLVVAIGLPNLKFFPIFAAIRVGQLQLLSVPEDKWIANCNTVDSNGIYRYFSSWRKGPRTASTLNIFHRESVTSRFVITLFNSDGSFISQHAANVDPLVLYKFNLDAELQTAKGNQGLITIMSVSPTLTGELVFDSFKQQIVQTSGPLPDTSRTSGALLADVDPSLSPKVNYTLIQAATSSLPLTIEGVNESILTLDDNDYRVSPYNNLILENTHPCESRQFTVTFRDLAGTTRITEAKLNLRPRESYSVTVHKDAASVTIKPTQAEGKYLAYTIDQSLNLRDIEAENVSLVESTASGAKVFNLYFSEGEKIENIFEMSALEAGSFNIKLISHEGLKTAVDSKICDKAASAAGDIVLKSLESIRCLFDSSTVEYAAIEVNSPSKYTAQVRQRYISEGALAGLSTHSGYSPDDKFKKAILVKGLEKEDIVFSNLSSAPNNSKFFAYSAGYSTERETGELKPYQTQNQNIGTIFRGFKGLITLNSPFSIGIAGLQRALANQKSLNFYKTLYFYHPAFNITRDTDKDGIFDISDNCPYDSDKSSPKACGCGVSESAACPKPIISMPANIFDFNKDGIVNELDRELLNSNLHIFGIQSTSPSPELEQVKRLLSEKIHESYSEIKSVYSDATLVNRNGVLYKMKFFAEYKNGTVADVTKFATFDAITTSRYIVEKDGTIKRNMHPKPQFIPPADLSLLPSAMLDWDGLSSSSTNQFSSLGESCPKCNKGNASGCYGGDCSNYEFDDEFTCCPGESNECATVESKDCISGQAYEGGCGCVECYQIGKVPDPKGCKCVTCAEVNPDTPYFNGFSCEAKPCNPGRSRDPKTGECTCNVDPNLCSDGRFKGPDGSCNSGCRGPAPCDGSPTPYAREYCACGNGSCCPTGGKKWEDAFCSCGCGEWKEVGKPVCAGGGQLDSKTCSCTNDNACNMEFYGGKPTCAQGALDIEGCSCKTQTTPPIPDIVKQKGLVWFNQKSCTEWECKCQDYNISQNYTQKFDGEYAAEKCPSSSKFGSGCFLSTKYGDNLDGYECYDGSGDSERKICEYDWTETSKFRPYGSNVSINDLCTYERTSTFDKAALFQACNFHPDVKIFQAYDCAKYYTGARATAGEKQYGH